MTNSLNFSESGWWGRILFSMKPLFLLTFISLSCLSVTADDEGKHLFLLSGLHSAVMQTTEPSDMDMNIRFGPAIIPSKTGIVLRSYSADRFPDSES